MLINYFIGKSSQAVSKFLENEKLFVDFLLCRGIVSQPHIYMGHLYIHIL